MNEARSLKHLDPYMVTTAERDDGPVGIVALWRLLWRNKLLILAPTLICGVIAVALVLRAPATYTADAQLLLSQDNLDIIGLENRGTANLREGLSLNALTILRSRSLAQQVVTYLDLADDPRVNPALMETEAAPAQGWSLRNLFGRAPAEPALEDAWTENLRRQYAMGWLDTTVQIAPFPESNLILVRATTTDPELSADLANAYVDLYLEYQRELRSAETERAAEALSQRVGELRLALDADQRALQEYRNSIRSLSPEYTAMLAAGAARIRPRLAEAEQSLAGAESALATLDGLSGQEDIATIRDLVAQHDTLGRLQDSVLGRPINSGQVSSDLAALRREAEAEQTRSQRLQAQLRENLDELEAQSAENSDNLIRLSRLEVELETTSEVYEAALARLKQMTIQSGLREAGAQVFAAAEVPLRADPAARRRTIAIALAFGLFVGITIVLLREAANDRVRRGPDLAEISGSGSVVLVPGLGQRFWRKRLPAKQIARGGSQPFFEAVRALRQRLLARGAEPAQTSGLVVGVVSGLPREGKSTLALALARSCAAIDKHVVLIDSDMRTGALSKSLGLRQDLPGLQQVLANKVGLEAAVQPNETFGLDVLPAGPRQANPGDLLESARFSEVIAILRQHYDLIIVDTPPVLVTPEARKIAAELDRHVFVTEFNRTPRPAARDAVSVLAEIGVERPVMVLYNAPEALGGQYGVPKRRFSEYWA